MMVCLSGVRTFATTRGVNLRSVGFILRLVLSGVQARQIPWQFTVAKNGSQKRPVYGTFRATIGYLPVAVSRSERYLGTVFATIPQRFQCFE